MYLAKGKFKAFSDNHSLYSAGNSDEDIDKNMELARIIQQHYDSQSKLSKDAEKRARKLAKRLHQKMRDAKSDNTSKPKEKLKEKKDHKDKKSISKCCSLTWNTRSKSKTPLGLGAHAGRASLKLPRKSGLHHAMGKGGGGGESGSSSLLLLSSLSLSSESSLSLSSSVESHATAKQRCNKKNKECKKCRRESSPSSSSSSSPSSSRDSVGSDSLFANEPPLDHSSDSLHKHEKNH